MKEGSTLVVRLATDERDLEAAKRLRYRVFVEEFGADGDGVDHARQLESDSFDEWVDHLVLIDRRRDEAKLEHVIGVYRLLRGDVASSRCGFYSSSEFDLSALTGSGRSLVELGRSCVHADYRGGTAVYQLWRALACYVLDHEIEIMFGVASFHGTDLSSHAPALAFLHRNHLAPPDMRVRALTEHYVPLDNGELASLDRSTALAAMPSLIKGYLRLGGFVGDGAFIDRDFNTVDICLVMDTARMSERHRNYYIKAWAKQ